MWLVWSFVVVLGYALFANACTCTPNTKFPNKQSVVNTTALPIVSKDVVMFDGVSYGYLVKTPRGTYFLTGDVKIIKSTQLVLPVSCPTGYRPPTTAEMEEWLMLDYQFLTSSNGMNANSVYYYISSNKAYPSITDGSNNQAWEYPMISLDSKHNLTNMVNISTYWNQDKSRCKCVRDIENYKSVILGIPSTDLVIGTNYLPQVLDTGLLNCYWNFNQSSSTSCTDSVFTPYREGCNYFTLNVQLWTGDVFSQCIVYYSYPKFGTNDELLINSPSQILSKSLAFGVTRNLALHFATNTAPMAPIPEGGVFILYANNTNSLFVMQLDEQLNEVAEINLFSTGYPIDIAAASSSDIVLLLKDYVRPDWLYIQCMSKTGSVWSIVWNQTIMNNGDVPNFATDQITFYNNGSYTTGPATSNDVQFGMNAMYKPHNGRLAYVRDRIVVIFAHYNHFGTTSNGARIDHTGDTLMTFDSATGKDITIGWSWQTSHSLVQQMSYDGQKIFTAALGDEYPQQIAFNVLDIDGTNSKSSSMIIPGTMPGCGCGSSSGRLGGLMVLLDDVNAATYARRASSAGDGAPNYVNELGLVVFNASLSLIKYQPLTDGSNVNIVKSAKLGNRIVIGFTRVSTPPDTNGFLRGDVGPDDVNTMYLMMVTYTGAIVTPPFKVYNFSLTSDDNWRVLNDGSVVWTYVTANGELRVYWLVPEKDSMYAYQYNNYYRLPNGGEVAKIGGACVMGMLVWWVLWWM